MLQVIEALLVLQDRDRRLNRLKAEIEAVPGQRKVLEGRALQTSAAFDAVRHQSQHLESERKRLELEVDSLKQRVSKVSGEQLSTRSNDQYKAFQHQIETTRGEISKLEDQQLALMEQAEGVAKELAAAQKIATAQKVETERQITELGLRETNLRQELTGLVADRATQASRVEAPSLGRYESIARRRGDHVLVGVDNGVCGGCHMQLPQHVFLKARGQQEIPACPTCTRLLYFTRDMTDGSREGE